MCLLLSFPDSSAEAACISPRRLNLQSATCQLVPCQSNRLLRDVIPAALSLSETPMQNDARLKLMLMLNRLFEQLSFEQAGMCAVCKVRESQQ